MCVRACVRACACERVRVCVCVCVCVCVLGGRLTAGLFGYNTYTAEICTRQFTEGHGVTYTCPTISERYESFLATIGNPSQSV